MNNSKRSDPAERSVLMRLFYRNWRPTRLGRWSTDFGLGGLAWGCHRNSKPAWRFVVANGRKRSNPVVIATVEGKHYLVSMLGPGSDWVKNVEAAHGDAVIRQGLRHRVHLSLVPREERAPILREYVRTASSGRRHFPLPVSAPLADFGAIAECYPVYRINAA